MIGVLEVLCEAPVRSWELGAECCCAVLIEVHDETPAATPI
jgi:hypothetical protein